MLLKITLRAAQMAQSISPFDSSYPSVTGAELPLASHHSSLVGVGPLHLPRQVFYLCFQLGLLVLKLQTRRDGKNNYITTIIVKPAP